MNAIVKISEYQGTSTPDKQGKMPVFCSVIAGSFPRSMIVMAGTSAEMYDLEVGKTYAVAINDTNRRVEYTTHDGRNGVSKVWALTNTGTIDSTIEILQASALVGEAHIMDDVLIGDEIAKAASQEPTN